MQVELNGSPPGHSEEHPGRSVSRNDGDQAQRSRRAISYPAFRALWLSNFTTNTGILVQSVGASWLLIEAGAVPSQVALVQTAASLPLVLLSPMSGAIADNFDRRLIMLLSQLGLSVLSCVLAAMAWTGLATPWLIICGIFMVGCCLAFNGPALLASVSDVVPREALPSAVVSNAIGMNIARSIGPAIGGAIVAAFGAVTNFVVNALSSLGLVFLLLRWQSGKKPSAMPQERLSEAISAGFRYVAMSPQIQFTLARTILFGTAASTVQALMPLVARNLLHGGVSVFGLLFGAFGVGALAGAFLSSHARRLLTPEQTIITCTLASALGNLGSAFSTSIWMTLPSVFLAGSAWVIAFSTFNVAVQFSSPRWVVARTLSLYQMSVFIGVAAGGWLGGEIADLIGTAGSLIVAAAFGCSSLIATYFMPLARAGINDLDPSNSIVVRDPAWAVEPRSGPIEITIRRRIEASDIDEFLELMAERRRFCMRDGARRWSLYRDLDEPSAWVERYTFPIWLDYLRQARRRTRLDDLTTDRLREIAERGGPIEVSRRIERQPGRSQVRFPPREEAELTFEST